MSVVPPKLNIITPARLNIITEKPKIHKKSGRGITPYSEVVEYLESINYKIMITESEYNGVKYPIPVLCSRNHPVKVRIYALKKGSTCCHECGLIKKRETCMKRYGATHHMKNKEIKQKSIDTCMKKYGVPHSIMSSEAQEKTRKTWLNKYGTDNPMKTIEIQMKQRESCKIMELNMHFRARRFEIKPNKNG